MEVNLHFNKSRSRCVSASSKILIIILCFVSFYASSQEKEDYIEKLQNTSLRINPEGKYAQFTIKIEKDNQEFEKYEGEIIILKDFRTKNTKNNTLSAKEEAILKMTLDVTKEPFFLLKDNKELSLFNKRKIDDNSWIFEAQTIQAKKFLKILTEDTYSFSPKFDNKGNLMEINTKMTSSEYHHHNFDIFYQRELLGIEISNIKGFFLDTKTGRKAIINIVFNTE